MEAGEGDVRAGVGVVDRVDRPVLHQRLAGVELPPEEGVDQPADRHGLVPGRRIQESVVHRVAGVHRLVRVEAHDHRLSPDRQAPGEHVITGHRLLEVHQTLA